jgi:hypothetical protein
MDYRYSYGVICHSRTPGSKNGVRRYQTPEGKWTPEGLLRRRNQYAKEHNRYLDKMEKANAEYMHRSNTAYSASEKAAKYAKKLAKVQKKANRLFFRMDPDKAREKSAYYESKRSKYDLLAKSNKFKAVKAAAKYKKYSDKASKLKEKFKEVDQLLKDHAGERYNGVNDYYSRGKHSVELVMQGYGDIDVVKIPKLPDQSTLAYNIKRVDLPRG